MHLVDLRSVFCPLTSLESTSMRLKIPLLIYKHEERKFIVNKIYLAARIKLGDVKFTAAMHAKVRPQGLQRNGLFN